MDNTNGRETFKKYLKSHGYDNTREYAKVILTAVREREIGYINEILENVNEAFGSEVKEDILFSIKKLMAEFVRETEAEDIEQNIHEDEYDHDQKISLNTVRPDLSFYDGHIEDEEDYEGEKYYTHADYESEEKAPKKVLNPVRRRLKK